MQPLGSIVLETVAFKDDFKPCFDDVIVVRDFVLNQDYRMVESNCRSLVQANFPSEPRTKHTMARGQIA